MEEVRKSPRTPEIEVRSERAMSGAKDVDTYIDGAPNEVRPRLRQVRRAIRQSAPDAVESISYGMPFYSFKGETGFGARLCYFGLLKKKIVFYTRPVFLEEHADEVKRYQSAKSALHFALDKPIPVRLIEKIVSTGTRLHDVGERN